MLYKAHRVCEGEDLYAAIAPILKTLTRDGDSWRTRDIRESEGAQSIWNEMHAEGSHFQWRTPNGDVSYEMPKHLRFSEADALEEEILFPEDLVGTGGRRRFKAIANEM